MKWWQRIGTFFVANMAVDLGRWLADANTLHDRFLHPWWRLVAGFVIGMIMVELAEWRRRAR